MNHTEFRALETHSHADRTDELFAGAVTAFCSLTRPVRNDIIQLEDLVMPLMTRASAKAKRLAAAALSESADAPKAVVMALAEEPAEISAPLLLRSPALEPVDLIAIIHRRGFRHARVIARRRDPAPELVKLLHSLDDAAVERALALRGRLRAVSSSGGRDGAAGPPAPASASEGSPAANALDDVRTALRDIMEENASLVASEGDSELAAGLIEKALDDNPALFETALADALGVSMSRARRIIGTEPGTDFFSALRSLGLTVQASYFVTGLVYGIAEAQKPELREFARGYRAIAIDSARATVRRWKAEEISLKLRRYRPRPEEGLPFAG